MDLDFGQILTQIFGFLIMLWVLKRYGWKPLLNAMEERKQKIIAEFQSIEEHKQENQRLAEEYNNKIKNIEAEARLHIQEAISQGRKIAHEIQEEAQKQAKDFLDRTKREIHIEIGKAKLQLKTNLINLSIAAAEKIIGEQLGESEQQRLITDFVKEVDLHD